MRKIFTRYYDVFLVIFFLGLSLFSLTRQININYLDYGEGSYLYEAWRFSQGEKLYGNLVVPQPPLLFLWGAFLMKISSSILFIRTVNLLLLLFGNLLFFFTLRKMFKHKIFLTVAGSLSLFLPITTLWWPTFTAETLLRPIIMLIVYVATPLTSLTRRKVWFIAFLSVLLLFTKYTAFPVILFIGFFFFLAKRDYVKVYVTLMSLGIFVVLILLQTITGGNYLMQTVIIRANLPPKMSIELIYNVTLFIFNYAGFIVLNLLVGIDFLKKRRPSESFLFLLPIFFSFGIIATFFQGTYNYIFYPVEPFFLLGFLYLPFLVLKSRKLITSIGLFIGFLISTMSIIFFFQSRPLRLTASTNTEFTRSTEKIVGLIEKNTGRNERILTPPYYAYLAKRKIVDEYSDPFLFLMMYLHRRNADGMLKKMSTVEKALVKGQVPVVVLDWRLSTIDRLRRAIEKNYKVVTTEIFAIEQNSVYLRLGHP